MHTARAYITQIRPPLYVGLCAHENVGDTSGDRAIACSDRPEPQHKYLESYTVWVCQQETPYSGGPGSRTIGLRE